MYSGVIKTVIKIFPKSTENALMGQQMLVTVVGNNSNIIVPSQISRARKIKPSIQM